MRFYGNSTVYVDDVSLVSKITGLTNTKEDILSVYVSGNQLNLMNETNGSMVDIYSYFGTKVQSTKLENKSIILSNLHKGIYIVRVGDKSSKIIL